MEHHKDSNLSLSISCLAAAFTLSHSLSRSFISLSLAIGDRPARQPVVIESGWPLQHIRLIQLIPDRDRTTSLSNSIRPISKYSLSGNEELAITGVDGSTEIWHNQLEVGFLHEVRFIRVQCCGKLSSVVSSNLMRKLHKIEGLKVWWCDSLEMIFDLQGGVCAGVGEEETSMTLLNNLELKYLPMLMHIWKCVPQQIHCFRNLSSLKVKRCDSLTYIFTISMARVLVNLQSLTVAHCKKVEKIVTWEKEDGVSCSLRFGHITLKNLPSLVCFGPDMNNIDIPGKYGNVTHCPKYEESCV